MKGELDVDSLRTAVFERFYILHALPYDNPLFAMYFRFQILTFGQYKLWKDIQVYTCNLPFIHKHVLLLQWFWLKVWNWIVACILFFKYAHFFFSFFSWKNIHVFKSICFQVILSICWAGIYFWTVKGLILDLK
jgi:hypothetical protein